MRIVNVDIMSNGSVMVSSGYDPWLKTKIRRVGDGEVWDVEFKNDSEQTVIVNDCRILTDTSQYNIGWHDGYRANHNDAAVAAAYLEIDKRMVASFKPKKDSIGE